MMKKLEIFEEEYIVITGATGFIGSCLVRYLNDLEINNLILVDDFGSSEKWKNLLTKKFARIFPISEILPFLKQKRIDIAGIIHLGAIANTLEKDVDLILKNNYNFSIDLATFSIEEEIPFLYASSAATYGDGKQGFLDQESRLESLQPLNPYGFSKHLFDLYLKEQNVLSQVIGMKFFNVFGPNEYHKKTMASHILHMVFEIEESNKVKLFKSNDPNFKDGEQQRDFIYVKDVVEMIYILLTLSYERVSGIYNIGSGRATTWKHLAELVFHALGRNPEIEFIDMSQELSKQYQNYTCADMTKFFALLNEKKIDFKIRSLDESVKEYVEQYIIKKSRW